jgi:hypothetical protein
LQGDGGRSGWPWFGAWTVLGGLLLFGWLTGFTVGLFVLPVALVGWWLAAAFGRRWPEVLGSVAGAGLTCLGIALANRGSTECPPGGLSVSAEEAARMPPGASITCGGADPLPWLVAGVVLLVSGVAAYAVSVRSGRPRDLQDLG